MKNDFDKAFGQFIRTSNATTTALVYLINDLVPVIGLDEAERLIKIIEKAQGGGAK